MKIPHQGEGSDIEILFITASHDDKKIGVTLGKNLINDRYLITEIVIYERFKSKFSISKLRDFDYPDVCKEF
jgi:hypothetical protein